MSIDVLHVGHLLISRNCVLKLRNVKIWAMPNSKGGQLSDSQESPIQAAKH